MRSKTRVIASSISALTLCFASAASYSKAAFTKTVTSGDTIQSSGGVAAPPTEPPLGKLFQSWSAITSPGCVIAARKGGRLLYSRAFGMADLERGVPNKINTVFEIGSNSKQFTAAAILLLAQDGKLKLTDDIRTYIPELPNYGPTITVDHLLNHTSGLRDWGEIATLQGWWRTLRAHHNQDALDIIVRQRHLNHAPGAYYSYTNSGYILLALIAEKVSGVSLPEFTRKRMFEPLGMKDTQWRDNFNRIVPNRAIAYWKAGEDYSALMPFENVYGPGGLLTTVNDMLIWNQALDDGRLGRFVTEELQREAKSNEGRPLGYARGVFVGDYKGTRMISHGGSTGAYQASLTRYPDLGLSFVLLCNADEVPTRDIEDRIVDFHLKLPARSPELPAGVKLSAKELADRSGTYTSDVTGLAVDLSSQEGRLQWNGSPLEAVSPNDFRSSSRRIHFDGPDTFLVTHENETLRFRKVEGPPLKGAELAALAGRYWSDEASTGYIAKVEEGKLTLRNEQRSAYHTVYDAVARDMFRRRSTVLRIERDGGGTPSAIIFSVPRVRSLRFQRIPGRIQPPVQ